MLRLFGFQTLEGSFIALPMISAIRGRLSLKVCRFVLPSRIRPTQQCRVFSYATVAVSVLRRYLTILPTAHRANDTVRTLTRFILTALHNEFRQSHSQGTTKKALDVFCFTNSFWLIKTSLGPILRKKADVDRNIVSREPQPPPPPPNSPDHNSCLV